MTQFKNNRMTRSAVLSSAMLLLAAPAYAQTACNADLDSDGMVGATDLAALLGVWGPCTGCAADIDGSGAVDAADLASMLALWGAPCNQLPWAEVLEQAPDPEIVTSESLRKSISATGYPWRVRDRLTQIEMVLIPPGSFDMGCSASILYGCNGNENPVHSVTLTDAFYIGRYEVTQAQWTAWMGSNPSNFQSASAQVPAAQVPHRPVENVSWSMAQEFVSSTGTRLPTEAEWEYACRAGTATAFHGWSGRPDGTSEDALVGDIGWFFSANCAGGAMCQTRPVGGKSPNGFGVHDMAGNVWEWVNDWYSGTYYKSTPATNPLGPGGGTYRVLRGGSWGSVTTDLRSSHRDYGAPESANSGSGFRVVKSVSAPSAFMPPAASRARPR